jgi:hypothetical protein
MIKKAAKATRNSNVFLWKVGDKAKIRVINGIQDDTNIEVKSGLKKEMLWLRTVYDCFKDLNSGDMVYVSKTIKKKTNSFSLDLYFCQ